MLTAMNAKSSAHVERSVMRQDYSNSGEPPVVGTRASHDELTLEVRLVPSPEDLQAGVNPVVYFRTEPHGSLKFINLAKARVWLTVQRVVGSDDSGR
jgi:hypothetical protein